MLWRPWIPQSNYMLVWKMIHSKLLIKDHGGNSLTIQVCHQPFKPVLLGYFKSFDRILTRKSSITARGIFFFFTQFTYTPVICNSLIILHLSITSTSLPRDVKVLSLTAVTFGPFIILVRTQALCVCVFQDSRLCFCPTLLGFSGILSGKICNIP